MTNEEAKGKPTAANRLFVFGLGYSALAAARELRGRGFEIYGTVRAKESSQFASFPAARIVAFDDATAVANALRGATHVLVSVPPAESGDPALRVHEGALLRSANLRWLGYFSSIGVYGDRGGAWVDEDTPVSAGSPRAAARLGAEGAWAALASKLSVPLDIFRLAGIYGPGRSALDKLRGGKARLIVKPDQVFNRIHVDDIAQVVAAAAGQTGKNGGVRVFNVADDEPASPETVTMYAAHLIGAPLPPVVPFDGTDMSPAARGFYENNRRVRNGKIKRELGVELRYPTYREGLEALANEGPTPPPPVAA